MTRLSLNKSDRENSQPQLVPTWLLIGLFLLIALVLVVSGIFFYRNQAAHIREKQINELQSIADLKVSQLLQWRLERLGDALVFPGSPFTRMGTREWVDQPDNPAIKSDLLAAFKLMKDYYDYQNVAIVTPDGQRLLSLDPSVSTMESATLELVARAAAGGQPIFGNFFRSPQTQQVYLDIAAPVLNENNQSIAVFILRVDPKEYLYPLIQSWPTPSQTAETLLIQKDGADVVYLNTLRHRADPPLSIRVPLTDTVVPAVQAILGRTGAYEGRDYRDVEVLSILKPVPGTPWFMVAKVDQAEMMAEVRSLGLTVGLFVLLAVLMTTILAVFTFNNRQRQLFQSLFQAEQQKRIAQEETRMTLYSIGDAVLTTDNQGRVTRLNPVAEELTGWKESEAQGKPLEEVFQIINEITRAEVENPVTHVLRDGMIVGLANHTLLISRDGREWPIADSGAPIRDENGKISGVVLVFRDQTEERTQQRERTLLTNTIGASLNEIYIFDAGTLNFRFVNEGAVGNLGYSLAEMREMTPLDLKPEFTSESFQRLIQPLVDKEKKVEVFETVHRRKDGSLYPVEVHLQFFDNDGDRVFLAAIQDITERKQAENLLREREEMMRYIVKYDPNAIAIYDRDLHYIAVSDRYLHDYEVQEETVIGKHHYVVFPEMPQRWKDVHQRVLSGVIERNEDDYFERPDGSITYNSWECRPWYQADGSIGGIITYTEVITERKRAELKLKEQLEELSRWHAATLGREERILELKAEINNLLVKNGQPPRYFSTADSDAGELNE